MIPFNVPTAVGTEVSYIAEVIKNRRICGDGEYTRKCQNWFEKYIPAKKTLLTTSCTHALEMAAFLLDIKEGDEVVLPSFTFVSTANAFVLRGAKIVFIDINPETMNMDVSKLEAAVNEKTKAVVVMHYAGVSCDMDAVFAITKPKKITVVEDAAQGFMSRYKGSMSGSLGTFGCYSFHETKNITCGEGGLLIINDERYIEAAEIIREKGTNRSRFLRGMVDKYTWVNRGSSYLPSELNAAYLFAQLESAETIQADRVKSWNFYMDGLSGLARDGIIELPFLPRDTEHNAHLFYIKTKDLEERSTLIEYLKKREIGSAFHYIPLHSSPAGKCYGIFSGRDEWTTRESNRLLRLPLWYGINSEEINRVVEAIKTFYKHD
ncbi:MAG: dTDP-4-amino-4,6-dideoxygalactose transaminase [Treponema sp.]|jgi:dTDP-4-amino-4,6-dideoxygalactose transaminase|nr:dTDP-4-amino-4,6-dideoxygalactose transaminase [Treponema sp.]